MNEYNGSQRGCDQHSATDKQIQQLYPGTHTTDMVRRPSGRSLAMPSMENPDLVFGQGPLPRIDPPNQWRLN